MGLTLCDNKGLLWFVFLVFVLCFTFNMPHFVNHISSNVLGGETCQWCLTAGARLNKLTFPTVVLYSC